MRTGFLLAAAFLCVTVSGTAQSLITSGTYYQTIAANVPGVPGTSQVSSLAINTATFNATYTSLDNLTNIEPFFVRGGEPQFVWTYNAGPDVRGNLTYAAGGHLNHLFANPDNPGESTRLTFTFAPHGVPKIRPNQTQLIVPVTFTVTGRIAVFTALGPGVPPEDQQLVAGQGTGTLIYRRRTAQYFTKAWRQTPQASLFLANVNLTFSAAQ